MFFCAGFFHSNHLALILTVIAATLFVINFCLLPESPRYLAYRGQTHDARAALQMFKLIDDKTEKTIATWAAHDTIHQQGYALLYNGTVSGRQTLTVLGLVCIEQLLGAVAMLFYMEKIIILNTTTGQLRR